MKKQNKQPKSLGSRFSTLLDYIIQRRIYLVESGLNGRTEYRMRALITMLAPYRGYKFTDKGAAEFIHNHYADLRQMIPEREVNIISQLENCWMAAKTHFILEYKKSQSCRQLSFF